MVDRAAANAASGGGRGVGSSAHRVCGRAVRLALARPRPTRMVRRSQRIRLQEKRAALAALHVSGSVETRWKHPVDRSPQAAPETTTAPDSDGHSGADPAAPGRAWL